MEFFSGDWLVPLLSIIVIDLVLAGDNAIVIGLAARNLPAHVQKKAVLWGTAGAIAIRCAATFVVVWLLKIPGLQLVGGILLIWIAYRLLVEEKQHDNVQSAASIGTAIRTIIIADAVMGLDNVLAIAGAAKGSFLLVIVGLLISVPIMVWGSMLIIRLIRRFPWIIYAGAGVLAYTSAGMITHESFFAGYFDRQPAIKWLFIGLVVIVVLTAGRLMNNKKRQRSAA